MTAPPSPQPEEVTYCQRHPAVESVLRCGRCDTLICPRCLVFTPAGTRCPDCAQLRRPPMYELARLDYARAAGTTVAIALALGVVGALIFPPGLGGFLFLTLAVFGGTALGGAIAEAFQWTVRHKRGVPVQVAAVSALVLGDLVRLLLVGGIQLLPIDLAATFLVGIASVVAWGRLR